MEELACNIEGTLKEKLHECIFYALAVDESTDQSDTAQLAIFVRDVDDYFNVFEELLALSSLKGQTRGVDILQALKYVMERNGLKLENVAGVATDGAPSTIGKSCRLIALLKKDDGADSAIITASSYKKIYVLSLCSLKTRRTSNFSFRPHLPCE